jgi:hypothetical protein
MPAHSRSKNGVLSHAYVAGIHVLTALHKARRGWTRNSYISELRKLSYLPQVG